MFLALAAAAIVACPFPGGGWTTLTSKSDMPSEAVGQAAGAVGELADKSEPFQVSDACNATPCRPRARFISAAAQGCDLVLTYEQGGRGYSIQIMRLRAVQGHWIRQAPSQTRS